LRCWQQGVARVAGDLSSVLQTIASSNAVQPPTLEAKR